MSENFGQCPVCGGDSDGSVMYSNPSRTRCRDCGKSWSYGPGIPVLDGDEAVLRRPGMYTEEEVSAARSRLTPWKEELLRLDRSYVPLLVDPVDSPAYYMVGDHKVSIEDMSEFTGSKLDMKQRYPWRPD